MTSIVIDTDAGADDLLALMLALMSEDLDVKAVIAGYGAFPVEEAVVRISKVMDYLNKQAPIIRGAAKPVKRTYSHYAIVHGDTYTNGNWISRSRVYEMDDLEGLVGDEMLDYVSLGTLTNLAALLDTPIAGKISKIVMMGGAYYYPGNVDYLAEANLYLDPESDVKVFSSSIPIYLFPLNVTEKIQLPMSFIRSWKDSKFILSFWKHYDHFYRKVKKHCYRQISLEPFAFRGAVPHDVFPLMYLLVPELFTIRTVAYSHSSLLDLPGSLIPVLRSYGRRVQDRTFDLHTAVDVDDKKFISFLSKIYEAK